MITKGGYPGRGEHPSQWERNIKRKKKKEGVVSPKEREWG